MINILFFIESLGGGGAEKVLFDIVQKLDKSKFCITVKTVTDNGVYDKEISRICKYESILKSKFNSKSFIKKLLYKIRYKLLYKLPPRYIYKMIIKEKYDIEVAFIEGYATKIIGSSTNKFSKKISWVHVDPIERNYADNYFRNIYEHIRCYSRFNKIICVSESVKNSCRHKYKIEDDKITTIYNPIDKEQIKVKANQKVTEIEKREFRLITVGRLVDQKGYDRLLRCINKLKNIDHINFELIIIGDGELKNELQLYIDNNNLKDTVKLLGFKRNPYKYIFNSDLFICSSRAEGFSLVIAEALVLGIPVISTNCSGPNELLGFGSYGILVDNNEEELYKALRKIINNKDKLDELKCLSEQGAELFDYDKCIEEIERIFELN